MKNQTLLLFLICFIFLDTFWIISCRAQISRNGDVDGLEDEVHVGVILDMGSWQGKVIQSCLSMAVSDFCSLHKSYKVRVILHVRDSKGEPFRALSDALNLLEDAKVGAILGAQTSLEAQFLAELGDKNKIPVISFSSYTHSSSPFSSRTPFFVQIGDDLTSQIKGVVALLELYKWRYVNLIHHELNGLDSDSDDDAISYMAALLEEKNIHISSVSTIAASSEDDQIIEQLHELKALETTVFIVHLPHSLASRLFVHAKRLGMISKGYAWIVTSKTMNRFNSRDDHSSSTIDLMQGVIGFRTYIPPSKELQNFTSRLRRKLYADQVPETIHAMQLGLLAYDVAWSLAKAAESVVVKVLRTRSNSSDFDAYKTSIYRSMFLQEMLRSNFKGLGGEFRFINGKLIPNTFEIVNVIGSGEKRVGFCSSTGRITTEIYKYSNHRRQLSDDFINNNNLESIIWPGGSSANVPQGRMLLQNNGKILKIGVPVAEEYAQLVTVTRDLLTNATAVTGFCIDVFKAALEGLNYQVQYQFIPFINATGHSVGIYNELIQQVYLKKLDAVVGDMTITASRSLYVDFTMSYTDIGVGIVAPNQNKDMWIIFKPLTPQLWLAIAGFLILSRLVIWLIEVQTPRQVVDGSLPPQRNRFSSILVGRRKRQLSSSPSSSSASKYMKMIMLYESSLQLGIKKSDYVLQLTSAKV
ncbi:hypothetical protein PTKIN_Ptkin15bG0146800 [Pterospermum kingtungense]